MTTKQVANTIMEHGLYCIVLNNDTINLTDKDGNVYSTIIWDGKYIVDDAGKMNLKDWLGY